MSMLKMFLIVIFSILLGSLLVVGARVAGPVAPMRQASELPEANSDGDTKAPTSSWAASGSPQNQMHQGSIGNSNSSASSAGNGGVMWVAPSRVSLPKDLATLGYKFNATVWLNMTQNIRAYQVVLVYNRSQLKCDRVGFTDGRTSVYFEGHYSCEDTAVDTGAFGNGSFEAYECCVGSDYISGPRVASLVWAEFEVVAVPSGNVSFTSKFDITSVYSDGSANSWVWDPSDDPVQIAFLNGCYDVLSTSDLSVSVNPAALAMQVGQSQLFTANATGGSSPYIFQWYNDYEVAVDGTGSNWTFTPSTVGSHQVYVEVKDSSNVVVISNFVSVDVASPDKYNVTINAICDTEAANVSVPIMMDGSSTGLSTPQTFTGLAGTHNFTVPILDLNGHSFRLWDRGSAMTTLVLSNGGTYTAHYGGDQWTADSMWVEPASVKLSGDLATVGNKFNVTFWLNMTENIWSYEIALHYNRTQLKCDRVGYTDGGNSEYFTRHYSSAEVAIDRGFLGNGSILAYEICSSSDYVQGPRVASLLWAEFEVVAVPSGSMSFTSKFDISTEYPQETWVWDTDGNNIQIALHDGNFQILGPEGNVSGSQSSYAPNGAAISTGSIVLNQPQLISCFNEVPIGTIVAVTSIIAAFGAFCGFKKHVTKRCVQQRYKCQSGFC